MQFGGIEICRTALHQTADGQTYLVTHGDEFDVVIRSAKWLAILGDHGYEFALWLNNPLNWIRKHLGFGYWSLSAYLKYSVKSAVNFIGAFEDAVASEAGRQGADGVICGHIHHAADRQINGVHYLNCGDWVESCSALIERDDGSFEIVRWSEPTPTKLKKPEMIAIDSVTSPSAEGARIYDRSRSLFMTSHTVASYDSELGSLFGVLLEMGCTRPTPSPLPPRPCASRI